MTSIRSEECLVNPTWNILTSMSNDENMHKGFTENPKHWKSKVFNGQCQCGQALSQSVPSIRLSGSLLCDSL